jgi:arabinogalactan endo-1,4-beta-galactosidase
MLSAPFLWNGAMNPANSVTSNMLRAAVAMFATVSGGQAAEPTPQRFAGVDLSYVNEVEACGAQFRLNGQLRDAYELFAESGANLVRLRLWNNPTWTNYSNEADVTRSIERARKAGMHVLLDFHYSDDWADPQKQTIPTAWGADLNDPDKLAAHVYEYTRDVLARLNARGLLPHMVQVGNEINTQMLRPAETTGLPIDWARNAKILNAGIRAVREARAADGSSPKVMLHVAQPENVEPWFSAAKDAGVHDFDYIGVSYYPKWSKFNMSQAQTALAAVKKQFKADIIVVEVSYPWTLRDAGDKASNILGEDSLARGYPATPSGQQRFMHDVVNMTLRAGGVGVVYWEPAWVSTSCATRWGTGSHWENATLFDFRKGNELMPAADFLKAIRGK